MNCDVNLWYAGCLIYGCCGGQDPQIESCWFRGTGLEEPVDDLNFSKLGFWGHGGLTHTWVGSSVGLVWVTKSQPCFTDFSCSYDMRPVHPATGGAALKNPCLNVQESERQNPQNCCHWLLYQWGQPVISISNKCREGKHRIMQSWPSMTMSFPSVDLTVPPTHTLHLYQVCTLPCHSIKIQYNNTIYLVFTLCYLLLLLIHTLY